MRATYRIETTVIANVTLYIEADDEGEALAIARAANDEGATAVRSLLAIRGGEIEAESLALDTASVERDDL